jgi:SAM-dependent methyltransferase
MVHIPAIDAQPKYLGEELAVFRNADCWKRYLASRLRVFLIGDVLEVGAGQGANVPYLYRDDLTRWVSLEPDERLCDDYRCLQAKKRIPASCELVQGTLQTLAVGATFDSILYIDVLEHIHDDRAEFARAYQRLRPGGHLMIICPAHGFLFSAFDEAIGHFRRYDKRKYRELSDRQPLKMEYLDSVGTVPSIANKVLLKQPYVTQRQVQLWDRLFVRLSCIVDPVIGRMWGKSILGVWTK